MVIPRILLMAGMCKACNIEYNNVFFFSYTFFRSDGETKVEIFYIQI